MSSGVTFDSSVIKGRITEKIRTLPGVFGQALTDVMSEEMKESMARTPVEFGNLRDSHRLTPPQYVGKTCTVSILVGGIGVGGVLVDYAVYVHENLEALHPVGQAKFLESTLYESQSHIGARVAQKIYGGWIG